MLSVVIVKKGDGEIPGITDTTNPRRLGPKRASKIRALFALDKGDDIRKYVNSYRRTISKEGKKDTTKAPAIQRLVTPQRLQRKRHEVALKRSRAETGRELAAEYKKTLAKRAKARADHKRQSRLSSTRRSTSSNA